MVEIALDQPAAKAGWKPYQIYLVGLLFLVTVSNFMDRQILGILQEPIKRDLALSDWQLGVISGPSFALFYSLAAFPIARWAERGNRPMILTLALAVWSGMTALCGLAQNYLQLALCRVGVGAGEGGCFPVGQSLLSDNFTPRQRGAAMAVMTAGTPVAAFFSPLIGGLVAQSWGWRAAFVTLGIPGLLLAALLFFTVRERRAPLAPGEVLPARSKLSADLKWLATSPAFVFIFLGTMLAGMTVGSINIFTGSFFIRKFGLSVAEVGMILAIGIGLGGVCGSLLGGWLADRFAGARGRSYALVPCLGTLSAGALFLVTFTRESWPVALFFLIAGNVADVKSAPIYAAVQNMAPPHMRATAAAGAMLAMTGLGTGTGPLITGAISDSFAAKAFPTALGAFLDACPGGRAPKGVVGELASACSAASSSGLQHAMLVVPIMATAAAVMFYIASRHIRLDLRH